MDNNFYEPRREPRTRQRQTDRQKTPKPFMARVIIIQLVLSLCVTGILFAVCRGDSTLSQNVKSFYASICERDMAASEILGVFKKVAQFTFAPSTGWDGTFAPEEQTSQQEPTGETTEATGEKATFSPVYLTVNMQKPVKSDDITSRFGYRVSPITGEYSLHTGLDIAADKGTKIAAAYDGTVLKADYNSISGNYVIIEHSNTLKTTYNHCSLLLVKEGMRVKKGETLALVGATGYATGNHLHFEVILNGKYVNPLWVLNYGV